MRIISRLYFPENAPCPQVSTECRNRIDKLEAQILKLQGGGGVEFDDAKSSYIATLNKHALSENVADDARVRSRMLLEEAKDGIKWAILASHIKEENELKAKVFDIEATIKLAQAVWFGVGVENIYDFPEKIELLQKKLLQARQQELSKEEDAVLAAVEGLPPPSQDPDVEHFDNKLEKRLAELKTFVPRRNDDTELLFRLARLRDDDAEFEDPGVLGKIPDTEGLDASIHSPKSVGFTRGYKLSDDMRIHLEQKLHKPHMSELNEHEVLRCYDEDMDVEIAMKEYMFDYNDRSEASLIKLANCMEIGRSPFDLMIKADHMNTIMHIRNPLALHLSLAERSEICAENIKDLKFRLKAANAKLDTYLRNYGDGGIRTLKRVKKYDIMTEYLRKRILHRVPDNANDGVKFKKAADEADSVVKMEFQRLYHTMNMSETDEIQEDAKFVSDYEKHVVEKTNLMSELNMLTSEWSSLKNQTSKRLSELEMEIRELESISEKDNLTQTRIKALKSHLKSIRSKYNIMSVSISEHHEKVTGAGLGKIDIMGELQARTMARKALRASFEKYKDMVNNRNKRDDIFRSLDEVFDNFDKYKQLKINRMGWVDTAVVANNKYMESCRSLKNVIRELTEYVVTNYEMKIEEERQKKLNELTRQKTTKSIKAAEAQITHAKKRAAQAAKKTKTAKNTETPDDLTQEREDLSNVETWTLETSELQQRAAIEEMRLKIEKESEAKLADTEKRHAELKEASDRELKVASDKALNAEARVKDLHEKIAELETLRENASVVSLKETAELTAKIKLLDASRTALQMQHEELIAVCNKTAMKYRDQMHKNQHFWEEVQAHLKNERAYVKKLEQNNAAAKKRNVRYARDFAAQRLVISELRSQLQSLQKFREVQDNDMADVKWELSEADAVLIELADSHALDMKRLQLENDAAVTELNAEKTKLRDIEREMTQLHLKLGAEREANLLLRSALEKSENRVRSLELSMLKMPEENLKGKVELERRLDDARNDVASLEARVRKYEDLVRQNQDVMSDKTLEIEKLQQDAIRDRNLLEDAQKERGLLQQKLQTEHERFEQQEKRLDLAMAEKTELELRVADIEAKYEHAKQADDTLRRIQNELNLSEAEQVAMKIAMETAAAEATRNIGKLQGDLARDREAAELSQLKQNRALEELAEKTRLYDTSVNDVSNLRTHIASLEQQLHDSAVSVDELQKKLAEHAEHSDELRDQLHHENEVSNSTRAELAKVNVKYAALSQAAQQYKEKAFELSATIRDMEIKQQNAAMAASATRDALEFKVQTTLDKCTALEDKILSLTKTGVADAAERTRVVDLLSQLRQEQSVKDREWDEIKNGHLKTVGDLTATIEFWKVSAECSVREIQIYESKTALKDGIITQLQNELSDTKMQLQKAEEQARIKENENIRLRSDLQTRDSQIERLNSILNTGDENLQTALQEKTAIKKELIHAKAQLALHALALGHANAAVQRSKSDAEADRKKIEHSERQLEALDDVIETLQTDQEEKQRQIATLKSQAAVHEAKINDSEVTMRDLRQQIEELNKASCTDQVEMETMRADLQNMQHEFQQTIDGVVGEAQIYLRTAIADLEQRLAAAEQSEKRKDAAIAKNEADLSTSSKVILDWRTKYDTLLTERNSLTKQLNMDRVEMAQRLTEKENAILVLNAGLRDITAAYDKGQVELTESKQVIARKEHELKTTEINCVELKRQLAATKSNLIQEQALRAQVERDLVALNEGWETRLSNVIAEYNMVIGRLQTQVGIETAQKNRLEAEVNQLVSGCAMLESMLRDQRTRFDELTTQKREVEDACRTAHNRVGELQQKQKELEEKLSQNEFERQELKRELFAKKNIEAQLDDARRQIGADSVTIHKLTEQLDAAKEEIKVLIVKANEMERIKHDTETYAKHLQSELSAAKSISVTLESKLRDATESYKQQAALVAAREREIVQLKKRVTDAEGQKNAQDSIIREYEREKTMNKETIEMLAKERDTFITQVLAHVGAESRHDDSSMNIETAAILFAEFEKRKGVTELKSELEQLRIALANCEAGKADTVRLSKELKKCREELSGKHSRFEPSVLRPRQAKQRTVSDPDNLENSENPSRKRRR